MVGYRHFDTNDVEPLFPFGFGLSYTSFEYSNVAASQEGDKITVTLNVKNNGEVAGREVVQLYVAMPKVEGLLQPVKELKAFAKSPSINPGETATVTMTFCKDDLKYFDEESKQWTLAPGEYTLMVAANAEDVRLFTPIAF